MSDYGRNRRKGSIRSAYGGYGYNKGRGYGSGSFRGGDQKNKEDLEDSEDAPKVYTISVNKLVGNPNVDNTKYTHHPYPCCCPKKNWCPPRGIPPFCFQQKTLSLQINRSGNGGPPDCCYKAATSRDINYDANNDGSPPKRKVYCRFQNPGMPSCPVCLECCPIVNGNSPGNNKKDGGGGGGSKAVGNTTAKGPPEVNPNSPFFNNCNFYNITCGTGTPQGKPPKKKSRTPRSRSFSSYNYNYPYRFKSSNSKGASEEKGSDFSLGPDMDYLERRSSLSIRQNEPGPGRPGPAAVEVETDDPPPAGPRFNTISTPVDV